MDIDNIKNYGSKLLLAFIIWNYTYYFIYSIFGISFVVTLLVIFKFKYNRNKEYFVELVILLTNGLLQGRINYEVLNNILKELIR